MVAEKLDNQEDINHPNTMAITKELQQILTIGLVKYVISHFSVKIADLPENLSIC
jgi:hypothetical protein